MWFSKLRLMFGRPSEFAALMRERGASERLIRIAETIEKRSRQNPKSWGHGTSEHRYKMYDVISEQELGTIESLLGVRLPEEYRDFLLYVGNGGAGPGYGLYSLQKSVEMLDGADPSVEFPHVDAWTPTFEGEGAEAQYEYEKWLSLPEHANGALPIVAMGCGVELLLITSGPERGNVWVDDRANADSIHPDRDGHWISSRREPPISFLDAYEGWLYKSPLFVSIFVALSL